MSDSLTITFEGDALRMVNRLCARHSKTPAEMVQFALEHLNLLLETLEPGQSVTISKKEGESFLTVSDVLGPGDLDRDGG